MFKKTLSLILAIAMLCTLVPFAAIAGGASGASVPEAIYYDYLNELGLVAEFATTARNTNFAGVTDAIAAKKWICYTEDSGGGNNWGKKYWYGDHNASSRIDQVVINNYYFSETTDYYVITRGINGAGAGARYLEISVDGNKLMASGQTSAYKFEGRANTSPIAYMPNAVNISAGNHEILLEGWQGYRLDAVAFVPKAEVDLMGGIAAYSANIFASAETFGVFANRTSEKAFSNDGTDISLDVPANGQLKVTLSPTATSFDLEYQLLLNGTLVETLAEDVTEYTITEVPYGDNKVEVVAVIKTADITLYNSSAAASYTREYPAVPYFEDASVITNVTDVTNLSTQIDISWNAATFTEPSRVAYNVYLDGEKVAENVAVNSYSFTGLTAGTEYDVKVVATLDGTEATESISALTASFSTSRDATATLLNVEDTTATIKVTGKFSPASDYEFSNSVVTADGVSVASSITDDVITVSGLTPSTKYELIVSFDENKKGETTKVTSTVSVEAITYASAPQAPAPEAIYYPYLEEKGIIERFATTARNTSFAGVTDAIAAKKWVCYTEDSGGGSMWFAGNYWYGDHNGSSRIDQVNVPLYFPATGEYYVLSRGVNTAAAGARYLEISIDGTKIAETGASAAYKFEGQLPSGVATFPELVTVSQGNHTIMLEGWQGYRLDAVAFVPKAEVDEAGGIDEFVVNNFSSKDTFVAFANRYKSDEAFVGDGSGLTTKEIQQGVVEVVIAPTIQAKDLDVSYNLYLNDNLIATLGKDERVYTINSGIIEGKNELKVEAVVGTTVNSSDTTIFQLNEVLASANVSVDGAGNVTSAQINLSAPAYMSVPSTTVNVLMVTYLNNRMTKTHYTTETLSATDVYTSPTYTFSTPTKLLQPGDVVDPTVLSAKFFVLDSNFVPIPLTY